MTDSMHEPMEEPRARLRRIAGLAGVYGSVGVGVLFKLTEGGLGGDVLVPMVVLQVAMAPLFGFAGYVSYRGRPRVVPVVVLATVGGAALITTSPSLQVTENHLIERVEHRP